MSVSALIGLMAWDYIVVGGGPSGSIVARELAKKGPTLLVRARVAHKVLPRRASRSPQVERGGNWSNYEVLPMLPEAVPQTVPKLGAGYRATSGQWIWRGNVLGRPRCTSTRVEERPRGFA